MNIGPYSVVKEVGRGAMGVVYKATDSAHDRTVAIKMIQGSAALTPQGRMGLVREARSAGSLHHPNILRIYDIGQHKGWLYIVMEYLQGAPLNKVISDGNQLVFAQKLRILIDLCDALEYAHSHGVVHRDVKPGNIFLTREYYTKVVDFGLAIQDDSPKQNVVAGTILYLAPELLRGAKQDSVSDLWAAAITAYELVSGKLPFYGPNVIHQIVSSPLPPLDASLPLAGELNRVLSRALSKNKDERFLTASSFSKELRGLLTALEMSSCATAQIPIHVDLDSSKETVVLALPAEAAQFALLHIAKPEPARPELQTPEPVEYLRGVDLGFRCATSGRVTLSHGEFWLGQLFRQFTSSVAELWGWAVPLAFVVFPFLMMAVAILFVFVFYLWFISLPLLLFILAVKLLDFLQRSPRCHGCRLSMSHTARWTRFVRSRAEVTMGYRDCMAALQEGLWQDAAKLLNVHSSEPTSFFGSKLISTPLRYHLDYYECRICAHHAARMTADTFVDDAWIPGMNFSEAYQGVKPASVPPLAFLRSVLPHSLGAIINNIRYVDLRVDSRAVIFGAAGLLLAIVYFGLSAVSHHAQVVNARYAARTALNPAAAKIDARTFARNEALAYYSGSRRPLDRQKAAWYFAEAAKRGDSFSANMLGTMYEKAFGVPQNYDKALSWYKTAAQSGNADAEFNLGRLHENGIGVPKNITAAMNWYNLAAKAGSKEAVSHLAQLKPQ